MEDPQAVLRDILEIQKVLMGLGGNMETSEGKNFLLDLRDDVLGKDREVRNRMSGIIVRRRP